MSTIIPANPSLFTQETVELISVAAQTKPSGRIDGGPRVRGPGVSSKTFQKLGHGAPAPSTPAPSGNGAPSGANVSNVVAKLSEQWKNLDPTIRILIMIGAGLVVLKLVKVI